MVMLLFFNEFFMSKAPEWEEKVFYLYDYTNELVMKSKKIYSPYNVVSLWRTKSEDYYRDPDSVEFKNWQYVASLKKLWPVRYAQQIEWLWFYNTTWWNLSKWEPNLWQWHINGRFYRNDWIHIIHAEKVKVWPEIEVKTIEKIVEKQQIPRIIAEWMNILQLKTLATTWGIEIPEDSLVWDSDNVKKVLVNVMTESWNISE